MHFKQLERCIRLNLNQSELKIDGFEIENPILVKNNEGFFQINFEEIIFLETCFEEKKSTLTKFSTDSLKKDTPERNKPSPFPFDKKLITSPINSPANKKDILNNNLYLQISNQDYQHNFKQAQEKYEKNTNSNNNNGENSNQTTVVKFVNTPNSSNKPLLINTNNGAPGKGFISPKGESNSHLSSFKIPSNSPQTNFIDTNKPTVLSLLEKKKTTLKD